MKKKFLHFKLLGVFVLALSLSLAGCKDYDDDIDNLQGQITELTSSLNTRINTVETAITTLQNKDTELKNDIATLKTQVDNAATETARLHAEALAAVATAKSEAIAAAKADLEVVKAALQSEIDAVKGKVDGHEIRMDAIETSLSLLSGRLDAIDESLNGVSGLKNTVENLETALAEALREYGEYKESIELQLNALEIYKTKTDSDIKDAQDALEEALGRINALENNSDLEAIRQLLDSISIEELSTLVSNVNDALSLIRNEMITSVRIISSEYYGPNNIQYSLDDDFGSNMIFNSTKAIVSTDFGLAAGYTDGFKFTKDSEKEQALSKVLIQISPVNASITKDQISLINSAGGTVVNDFLVVSEVNKFNKLLTRGLPTQTGLYEVTFKLVNAVKADHLDVTYVIEGSTEKRIQFAVAIDNTGTAAEERHVLSTFGVTATLEEVRPTYEMIFKVGNHSIENLANRYYSSTSAVSAKGLLDYKWISDDPLNNVDPTLSNRKELDTQDIRGEKDFFYIAPNKTFEISFEGSNQPYAYYVVLDKAGYGKGYEDNTSSEVTAWESYEPNITGLKKVVKGKEKLTLSINDIRAKEDIIGFRVMAVNADGTLLDPDGKAFYVYCGEVASLGGLNFNMTFTGGAAGVTTTIGKVAYNGNTNVSSKTDFVNGEYEGHLNMVVRNDVILADTYIQFYTGTTTLLTTSPLNNPTQWSNVTYVDMTGLTGDQLEDDLQYNGYIDLYKVMPISGQKIKVAIIPVSLKKTLPTLFNSYNNFGFKSESLNNSGTLVTYPVLDNANGKYEFTNSMNGLSVENQNVEFKQVSTAPAGLQLNSYPDWNAIVGANYIGKSNNGGYFTYTVNAYYNYGPISTKTIGDYIRPWDEGSFKMEFHYYMADCEYSWPASGVTIQYSDDSPQTIALSDISVKPPYGATFNNLGYNSTTNIANNTSDGAFAQRYRAIKRTYIKNASGAENEYFDVELNAAGTDLVFTKKALGGTSGPADNVPGTLYIVFTTDFGNDVTVAVNAGGQFTMLK